jgi:N-acetylneuraminate epimerase
MRVSKIIISLLIYTTVPSTLIAQHKHVKNLRWTIATKLPAVPGLEKQLGLAGVFSGISNNVLLIAGGSYFPDKMPWEGGKKAHTDHIFVLQKNGANKFTWLTSANAYLKNKIAYGASTTVANGVVCVGGETETANSSSDAFLMHWDAIYKKVVFHDLPLLPIPVANACITSIGKKVYLIGGESNGVPSAKAFSLDLAARHPQWEPLADLPIAMSHSVAVTQSNGEYPCMYVIGGRSATPSGISELHNKTYCYNPITKKWTALSNISDGTATTNLSAATGVAIGTHHILIIGGDKGNVFHQIETYNYEINKTTNDSSKQHLQAEKIGLITNHEGFSRDVLLYNTLDNSWEKTDQLPGYGHVTSIAVKWGNEVFIPSGEIKPGIRTPDILRGEILNELK